jgi:hypothetical protein
VEFALEHDEYEALKKRVDFFYYRRGPSRFLFLGADKYLCSLVDPDGRVWRFVPDFRPTVSPYTSVTL